MNITLISTDLDTWALGLRSISAVLKGKGHHTRLIFLPTEDRFFLHGNLEEASGLCRQADLIGISCLARGSRKAEQIIESLRSINKLIVWGGVHASLNPERCADFADIVCRGEGEEMMLDLVECLELGEDWHDIKNIAYKDHGTVKLNDIRPPLLNLDELPFSDFSFHDEHHLTKRGILKVDTLPVVNEEGRILFNSSRGCAFHCTYCCNDKIKNLYSNQGRYVRRMSVSRLIEYSVYLKNIFPAANRFYFIDEDFGARPYSELVEFSEEYSKKIGLPFECLAHPARITHKKMEVLGKAGIFRVSIGIESGSERTRKEIYDRHMSNEVVKKAAEIISNFPQCVPCYFFIIGNPYEERDDLIATVRLLSELPYGCYTLMYNLIFFPGTGLFERALQDGLIKGTDDSGFELDFLSGLNYKGHGWKKKNLSLNGLLFLMEGSCTRYRIGFLPRFFTSQLLLDHIIKFNEKHPLIIKIWISVRLLLKSMRNSAGRWLKRYIRNPSILFNPGYYLQMKMRRGKSFEYSPVDDA